jgi:hypothetical protein
VALLLAAVGLLLVSGFPAASVRAAPPPPTLTIVSPANNAVIGNGSPLSIVFVVTNFNLTAPGSAGPGPTANQGHVNVYVDGNLTAVASEPTVVLALESGSYNVRLRLVFDNGTPLTPDVSSSIAVTLTHGPAVGTPRLQISFVEITYPIPKDLLGDDIAISFRLTDFALVPPGRRLPVPNEGRVSVFLDGAYITGITHFEPVHFSDLPDGDHTIVLRLVDSAGQPLSPDVADSVTIHVEGEQKGGGAAIPDINPYLLIAQFVLGAAIFGVLFIRDWRRSQ